MSEKHTKGMLSEYIAIMAFMKRGWIVSKTLYDFNEYDLVVDGYKGCLVRVQVKTVYWDKNKSRWLISCVTSHIRGNNKRTNKKYKLDSFDYLCAVHQESKTIYMIPISKIADRRSVTLYPDTENTGFLHDLNKFEIYRI